VCKSQTNFAQRLVEREGEMVQGSQRQPFEMPFTFSLSNILSIFADHLSKKALSAIYPKVEATGDLRSEEQIHLISEAVT
jgi:hypothetical protein